MLKKNLAVLYISASIFLADRLSKFYILQLFDSTDEISIPILPFLNFTLIFNEGIAFGLFSLKEGLYYNIISIIIIFITLIIFLIAVRSFGLEKYSFSMILGGSMGNIFDRLYYSAVVDFIDISINNIHWFIFNIADIFISLGVMLLIIFEMCKKKK